MLAALVDALVLHSAITVGLIAAGLLGAGILIGSWWR